MSFLEYEILPMTESDLDEVTRLERECFSVPWSRESFVWAKNNENAYFIVAEDDGNILGYAGLCFVLDEGDIANVATAPEYRRRGIASALTSRLAIEILERGKVPFYCAAWSNVRSVRNAIRSGFRPAWVEMTAKPSAFVDEMNGIIV